jgi:Leucine-rich repeat (LRR) protein
MNRILIALLLIIGFTQSALAMDQDQELADARERLHQRWLQQNQPAPIAPAAPVQVIVQAQAAPIAPIIPAIPGPVINNAQPAFIAAQALAIDPIINNNEHAATTLSIQDLLNAGEELIVENGHLSLNARNISSLEGLQNFLAAETVTHLSISNNAITAIPNGTFDNFINLTELDLSNNQITDIHEQAFANTPQVKRLFLQHNELSTLPANLLEFVPKLEHLNLAENQLTCLPQEFCAQLTQLRSIDLEKNKFEEIDPRLLRNCTQMKWIDFSHNKITTVPVELMKPLIKLQSIYLKGNPISSLPSATIKLIQNRPIFVDNVLAMIGEQYSPKTACDLVAELRAQNRIHEIFCASQTEDGYVIDLTNRCLSDIDDLSEALPESLNQKVVSLHLSNNYLKYIPFKCLMKYPQLKTLHLGNNQITSLTAEEETEVKGAKVINIHTLSSCGLNELEILGLCHNKISHISFEAVEGLNKLRFLSLNHNEIRTMDRGILWQLLPALYSCDLSNNQLEEFEEYFGNHHNLKRLNLSHNHLGNSKMATYPPQAMVTRLPQSPQPLKFLAAKKMARIIQSQDTILAIKTLLSLSPDLLEQLKICGEGIGLLLKYIEIIKPVLNKISQFPEDLSDQEFDSFGATAVFFSASHQIARDLTRQLSMRESSDLDTQAQDLIYATIDAISIFDYLSEVSPLCKRIHAKLRTDWIRFIETNSIAKLAQQHPLDLHMFIHQIDGNKVSDAPQHILEKVQTATRAQLGLRYFEEQKHIFLEIIRDKDNPAIEEAVSQMRQGFMKEENKEEMQAVCELASPELLNVLILLGIDATTPDSQAVIQRILQEDDAN